MTAISNLVKRADVLKRNSLQSLDATINEIAKESTIQILIDIVLDLQHQLSDLIIFHIAFELPIEEAEKPEKKAVEPYTHEIYDYLINFGPINVYSGVLADTISEFETQTAAIISPYTLFPLFDTEELDTQFLPLDRTFLFETGRLYSELQDSGFMIKELETIRNRMAEISIEKISEVPERVPDTLMPSKNDLKTLPRSGIFRDIEVFSQYANKFSEIANDISATIRTGILEAKETIEISSLENISIEALSAVDLSRTSTAIRTEISKVQGATEISTIKGISTTSHAAAISPIGETRPEVIPDQRMIEIPAFMLPKKILTSEKESAINAIALSEAISKGVPSEKETVSFTRQIQTPSSMEVHNLPPSSAFVSNAFETISHYISIASALDNQINEMIGEGEENIFQQNSQIDLLTAGGDTVTSLFLNRTVSGGNGGLAGVEPNIGLATTQLLLQEGAAAFNDIILAVQYTKDFRGLPAATMPRAMENVMHLYGSPQETISPGESRNHFQNTFNININMKGGGEEHELRELGKKIGTILSEEIKRYGVIR